MRHRVFGLIAVAYLTLTAGLMVYFSVGTKYLSVVLLFVGLMVTSLASAGLAVVTAYYRSRLFRGRPPTTLHPIECVEVAVTVLFWLLAAYSQSRIMENATHFGFLLLPILGGMALVATAYLVADLLARSRESDFLAFWNTFGSPPGGR